VTKEADLLPEYRMHSSLIQRDFPGLEVADSKGADAPNSVDPVIFSGVSRASSNFNLVGMRESWMVSFEVDRAWDDETFLHLEGLFNAPWSVNEPSRTVVMPSSVAMNAPPPSRYIRRLPPAASDSMRQRLSMLRN
jgi:hypothetical protein